LHTILHTLLRVTAWAHLQATGGEEKNITAIASEGRELATWEMCLYCKLRDTFSVPGNSAGITDSKASVGKTNTQVNE